MNGMWVKGIMELPCLLFRKEKKNDNISEEDDE